MKTADGPVASHYWNLRSVMCPVDWLRADGSTHAGAQLGVENDQEWVRETGCVHIHAGAGALPLCILLEVRPRQRESRRHYLVARGFFTHVQFCQGGALWRLFVCQNSLSVRVPGDCTYG